MMKKHGSHPHPLCQLVRLGTPVAPVFALLFLMTACGTETGNPISSGGVGGGGKIVADPSVVSAEVSSHLADAQDAMSEAGAEGTALSLADVVAGTGSSADAGALATANSTAHVKLNAYGSGFEPLAFKMGTAPACAPDGAGNIVVSFERNDDKPAVLVKARRNGKQTEVTRTAKYSHTWNKGGDAVNCGPANFARIDWSKADGLSLAQEFSYARARKETWFKEGEPQRTRETGVSASGRRATRWAAPVKQDSETLLASTVTLQTTRALKAVTKQGSAVEIASALRTAEGAPLVVETIRAQGVAGWKRKTIVSGTLRSDLKDGARVETSFDKVSYDASSRCLPVSGTVRGKIFPSAADPTNFSTFEITFGGIVAEREDDDAQSASRGAKIKFVDKGGAKAEEDWEPTSCVE